MGLLATANNRPSLKEQKTCFSSLRSRFQKTEENDTLPTREAPHILVVDDDELICRQLERLFTPAGYRVTWCGTAEKALDLLQPENIDLVIADIRLPGLNGTQLTELISEKWPDIPVIIITGFADIQTAVEVLKHGASDFIVKPFSAAAIQESTKVVLEKAQVFTEIRHLRHYLQGKCEFSGMLSKTPEMHHVFETIRMVSESDVTVVVEGETGTGKELVASAIHYQSLRRKGPFITINCAGVPETLLESELFGYERGAFTGANQARPGKIELAHGGTLFLDEIESIPLTMQAKLLLVLHDQKVQRLGSSQSKQINMRIIAASNVPLKQLLAQGMMRADFYYRLNVVALRLLPLRQRLEDIPLLVYEFLRHHPVAIKKTITKISTEAMDRLMKYQWHGNIRELQNVLERAVVLAKSRVIEHLDLENETESTEKPTSLRTNLPLMDWLRDQEKGYLIEKLEFFGGRMDLTAKSCGVDVRTLHRKMHLFGIDKRVFRRRIFGRNLELVKNPSGTGRKEN